MRRCRGVAQKGFGSAHEVISCMHSVNAASAYSCKVNTDKRLERDQTGLAEDYLAQNNPPTGECTLKKKQHILSLSLKRYGDQVQLPQC